MILKEVIIGRRAATYYIVLLLGAASCLLSARFTYRNETFSPRFWNGRTDVIFQADFASKQPPDSAFLLLDIDGDGVFSPDERYKVDITGDRLIGHLTPFLKIGPGERLRFYFVSYLDTTAFASDLIEGPLFASRISFNISPDSWSPGEALLPLQIRTSDYTERLIIHNDGTEAISFALRIVNQDSIWEASPKEDGAGENTYVLSALFTDPFLQDIDTAMFNQGESDDVVSYDYTAVGGGRYQVGLQGAGVGLAPGDSVALWFMFRAPSTLSGVGAVQEKEIWVYITTVTTPFGR